MVLYCPVRSDTRPNSPFVSLDAAEKAKVAKKPKRHPTHNRCIVNEFGLSEPVSYPYITCDLCHGAPMSFRAMIHPVQPPERGSVLNLCDLAERSMGSCRKLGGILAGGNFMQFVPVMWSVWGFTILVMAILFLYRSRLGKDEEDQLFLADSFSNERTAQQAIIAKVEKVQPIIKVSEIVAAVATLFVIGYYILDIVNQFK